MGLLLTPGEFRRALFEFEQESDRGGPAADHDDALSRELRGVDVVARVHLAATEAVPARIPGDERRAPGSRRIDDDVGADLLPTLGIREGDAQVGVLVHDGIDGCRAYDLQVVVLLVSPVVIGDDLLRGKAAIRGLEAQSELVHARQIVDVVGGTEPKRLPAELPRARPFRGPRSRITNSFPGSSPSLFR